MWFLIIGQIICIKYTCSSRWVYKYDEVLDERALKNLIGDYDIKDISLTIENPYESKLHQSCVSSTAKKIIKDDEDDKSDEEDEEDGDDEEEEEDEEDVGIHIIFYFSEYTDFNFNKVPKSGIAFYTEFSVKYNDDNNKERTKIFGGFLVQDKNKNIKIPDKRDFSRVVEYISDRRLETILLGRISTFMRFVKSYSKDRISVSIRKFKKALGQARGDKSEHDLRLELCNLFSCISENRNSDSLGIVFKTKEKEGPPNRNKLLNEYAVERYPLVRKLENLFDFFYSSDVRKARMNNEDLNLDGDDALVKHTTCFFRLFDMLAFMHGVVEASVKWPLPREEKFPIRSYRNNFVYNASIIKEYGSQITKTSILYISVKDEDGDPCTETITLVIKIIKKNNEVKYQHVVEYLGKPLHYELSEDCIKDGLRVIVEVKKN